MSKVHDCDRVRGTGFERSARLGFERSARLGNCQKVLRSARVGSELRLKSKVSVDKKLQPKFYELGKYQ